MANKIDTKLLSRKMIFGAAIAYAAFWLALFIPLSVNFAIPIAGAIAILAVEWVSEKTGFFFI